MKTKKIVHCPHCGRVRTVCDAERKAFFTGKSKAGAAWLRAKCRNRLAHLRSIGK